MRTLSLLLCFFTLLSTISCSKKPGVELPINAPPVLFVKTFGGSNNESAKSIVKTLDGGYAVFGYTQSIDGDIPTTKSTVQYDLWLLKFDAQDSLQWQKTFGGSKDDKGYKIITTSDGGYVIIGSSKSNDFDQSVNNGFEDVWVLKLNAAGISEWKTTTGFLGTDVGYSIIQTTDGGYFLGSIIDVTASGGLGNNKTTKKQRHAGGDYWGIKLSSTGAIEWRKYFGGKNTDTCYDVVETSDGYIMIGSSDSVDVDINNNKGGYDFWVVKIDKSGNLLWEKSLGGSEIDEAYQIVKTDDGNFLLVGETRSSNSDITSQYGGADVWVVKINNSGNIIWQKNYGGTSFDVARAVVVSNDGNYLIAGSTRSLDIDVSENNGVNDVWVLKIDTKGSILWQKSIGGSDVDFAHDIEELEDGSIVIVGESNSNDKQVITNKGFTDLLLIKMK